MADPKLLRIVKAVQTRLEVINGLDPYLTNIGQDVARGKRRWNPDDLPACSVFMTGREQDEDIYERQSLVATLTVEARMNYTAAQVAEDWAIYMMADIQRAVETSDRSIANDLIKSIAWQSDSIAYPDNENMQVAVQVIYSIPHVRRYGDPIN